MANGNRGAGCRVFVMGLVMKPRLTWLGHPESFPGGTSLPPHLLVTKSGWRRTCRFAVIYSC